MLKKPPKLKSTIRSKAKGNVDIAAGSEAMIELLTLLFLNSLAEEAKAKAFEEKSATIRAHHVKAVSKKVLRKARG
ncbi:centromere protein W [Poecilia latipinna]|uniref:Centromere protein W n=2 Tax=Poecilia TaxID=8080 RepID=A0A3B3TXR0_9TELE|nr:PREDICTED: centromere protein W [Poecilia formosa]XP_014841242.1 PREDICTED: centromere protein W [Poecilia mexicana]XP_014890909.1 PREDICTED: centromere protein W [Poecilia latipinna]